LLALTPQSLKLTQANFLQPVGGWLRNGRRAGLGAQRWANAVLLAHERAYLWRDTNAIAGKRFAPYESRAASAIG
jgi:hypothetical protein